MKNNNPKKKKNIGRPQWSSSSQSVLVILSRPIGESSTRGEGEGDDDGDDDGVDEEIDGADGDGSSDVSGDFLLLIPATPDSLLS